MKNRPPAGCVNIDTIGGRVCACISMAESKFSKLVMGVRFTSRAPYRHLGSEVEQCFRKAQVVGSIPTGGSKYLWGRLAQLARAQARQA